MKDFDIGYHDMFNLNNPFPDSGEFTLLLDADFLMYRAGFSSTPEEYQRYLEGDGYLLDKRKEKVCQIIQTHMRQANAKNVRLFLTGKGNFRHRLGSYKANRKDREAPPFYHELKDWIASLPNATVSEGCEADDVLAMFMRRQIDALEAEIGEHPTRVQCTRFIPYVIGSPDKDLMIIEGYHLDLKTGRLKWVTKEGELTLDESKQRKSPKIKGNGFKFFCAQLIMGDPSDGYVGIPRKGASAAFKALQDCNTMDEMLEAVAGLYAKHYAHEWREAMELSCRFAWLQNYEGQMFTLKDELVAKINQTLESACQPN